MGGSATAFTVAGSGCGAVVTLLPSLICSAAETSSVRVPSKPAGGVSCNSASCCGVRVSVVPLSAPAVRIAPEFAGAEIVMLITLGADGSGPAMKFG